ncbi:hypothetical protein QOZ80_8BG0644110 [Eleusine coracana subsp. coracana]|nr:hypothetical protein QOZ80_8BG0644110 [Eleusine coracana subsp. coracana]
MEPSDKKQVSDGKKLESGEKKQQSDGKKKNNKKHESRRKSATPLQPLRRNPMRQAPVAIASASAPSASAYKSRPHPRKEEHTKEGEELELVVPPEPCILPLLPFIPKVGPEQGLGCEIAEGSLVLTQKREYKEYGKHTEGRLPLYAIGFNFLDARYHSVFATAGGNHVTTYRCLENGTFALLQAYIDEDKDESFYTISWARDHVDDSPLLVAAGVHGTIRVINCATEKLAKSFVSHGKAINEIKTQALKPSLIISASKDESIRLWNIHTGICIMIFAGDGGHRGEVLSVDFHPVDINRFMLTASVHNNYVDCTMWLGDFILSKSVENEILLWESSTNQINPTKGSIDILQKYPVPKCNLWFMKFSCDFHFSLLAIGNNEGKIYLWEVQSSPPSLITRLTNQQCKSPIRQTAVSYDGRIILGAGEDGNIWRWDEVDPPSSKK